MKALKRVGARVPGANWVFWARGAPAGLAATGGRVESSLILVPPTEGWDRGVEMWKNEELLTDIRVSGLEFVLGFGAGSLVGTVVGIITGNPRSAARLVDPYVNGLYAVRSSRSRRCSSSRSDSASCPRSSSSPSWSSSRWCS